MKNIIKIIVVLCLLISTSARAQTFSEWFKQGKTQRKYLLEQIAALQVYIDRAQKGYQIARTGLNVVGDIKNGDFNLHNNYFNSLRTVNPTIRKYTRILDIITMQSDILSIYRNVKSTLQNSPSYGVRETEYIYNLLGQILERSSQCLEALWDVITSGEMEMSDDQRIKRIDALHLEMSLHLNAMHGCATDTGIDMLLREKEQGEIEALRKLYEN